MWGKVALEKVSETADGQELFVIVFVEKPTTLGELTEQALRQLFLDANRPQADVDAMFRIAREVFTIKAQKGTERP